MCYNRNNEGQRRSKSKKKVSNMGISDKIEAFIIELMKCDDNAAEFRRNELADIFSCVPSQINYVISTRFGPERGYLVESRRGGGGYIRIRRTDSCAEIVEGIKDSCDEKTARAIIDHHKNQNMISEQSARIALTAVSDRALSGAGSQKNKVRADVLKNIVAAI